MRIRCPHCHNAVHVVKDVSVNDVECTSCGSKFTLVERTDTESYHPKSTKIEHFTLLDIIGSGSFGDVWRAHDTQLDRIVAIKIPRLGEINSSEISVFVHEAQSAAQLTHPNIVSVYEVGKLGQSVYIVAEYVDGVTLKEWSRSRPLPPREAVSIVRTLAVALAHAHDRGVIHRDLKPDNILINEHGDPKITDFGLARREGGEISITTDGTILGTLLYMSPEQASGRSNKADGRSDIYSLGVILFELLTGATPFRGEKQMLIYQIKNDPAISPRKLQSRISRDLETICLKCMEKLPTQRYLSCLDLEQDLCRYLEGEPIKARPIGRVGRLIRWSRRKPATAGMVCAVLFLILALAIGGPTVAIQQWMIAGQQSELAKNRKQLLLEREDAKKQEIESEIDRLVLADADSASVILKSLIARANDAGPLLLRRLENSPTNPNAHARVSIALVEMGFEDDALVQSLVRGILTVDDSLSYELNWAIEKLASQGEVVKQIEEILSEQDWTSDEDHFRLIGTMAYLGEFGPLLDLISDADQDPTMWTRLSLSFSQWTGPVEPMLASLAQENDEGLISFICVALGNMPRESLNEEEMDSIEKVARNWYESNTNSGVHGASKWLLTKLGEPTALTSSDVRAAESEWRQVTDSITLVRINGGSMVVGEGTESLSYGIETREASLDTAFWISDTEISVAQFESFLKDPSYPDELKPASFRLDEVVSPFDECPVQSVKFHDAILFCNWLSWKDGLDKAYIDTGVVLDVSDLPGLSSVPKFPRWTRVDGANGYRLPTFLEWEFAARAGARTEFSFGDISVLDSLGKYAWYSDTSWIDGRLRTHSCGSLAPNRFGLFDMHGNVQEMCDNIPVVNSNPSQPYLSACRGGAFDMGADQCFSGMYLPFVIAIPMNNLGFRVARTEY